LAYSSLHIHTLVRSRPADAPQNVSLPLAGGLAGVSLEIRRLPTENPADTPDSPMQLIAREKDRRNFPPDFVLWFRFLPITLQRDSNHQANHIY